MKNLLKTVVLAGVVAAASASAAFAGGNPQLMAQRSYEYWNTKSAEPSKATGEHQAANATATPKASEYPCGQCVYDQQLGGYVQKHYGKN